MNVVFNLGDQELLSLIISYLDIDDVAKICPYVNLSKLFIIEFNKLGFKEDLIRNLIKKKIIITGPIIYNCLMKSRNVSFRHDMKVIYSCKYFFGLFMKRKEIDVVHNKNLTIYKIYLNGQYNKYDYDFLFSPDKLYFDGITITNRYNRKKIKQVNLKRLLCL